MKRPASCLLTCALLAVVVPLVASAQVVALNLNGKAPGTYYCEITVKADGTVTAKSIPVVVLDGSPAPTPTPEPDPAVLSTLGKQIKAAAEKATTDPQRANTANGLAVAAKSVKILIDDGTLNNYEAISKALAYLWDATTKHEAWTDTRGIVFSALATLAQEGADARSYAVCLGDVEAGLKASVPSEQLQSGELDQGTVTVNGQVMKADWAEIMKVLLEIFVKYILPLIVTAQ